MSALAPAKTHCPNCGAKLHRPDLSLCAYCAMPLDIGATTKVDDETIQRLKRMREHANFAAAMSFTPRDPRVERKAARLLTYGSFAMALAILSIIVSLIVWWRGSNPMILAIVGITASFAAAAFFVTAPTLRRSSDARSLMKRPALVVLRRSEIAEDGITHYYFTLRFDDGSEGEFSRPGLGTMYEPMANGYSGIAYTRGAELVDFRRLT
ncbi:MAG: hypothetical protein SGI72_05060 [Planctomycetota bacterium]|nr:hypothetical protein [Planctomycetota bacterium]